MNTQSNENVLDSKLSKKEQEEIKMLNSKSNKIRKDIKENDDPLNMSTNFINNLSKYKSHFNDIDDTNNWVSGIGQIINKIYTIFTKKQRTIYIGFTLILLSFALYIIQITS